MFEIVLFLAFVLYFFYELSCIHVPKNFEAPWSYRLNTVFFKIVTLIAILMSKFTKTPEPIIIRNLIDLVFSFKSKRHSFNNNTDFKFETYKINNVPIKIFSPTDTSKKYPCMIYIHGGGFFLGDLGVYDNFLNQIAVKLNIVVIAIDYRLAPENPFPCGVEDCWTVMKYFLENNLEFNADSTRTILAGDSAGGNLVSVVMRRLIEHDKQDCIKLVAFITPVSQLYNLESPSHKRYFPRGLISYFTFYTGKLVYWYLGIPNSTKEMNEIFINNLHTLAIDDENLRDRYKRLTDLNMIPECYKSGRDYYSNIPVFPNRSSEPSLFKTDPKLKNMIKILFNKEISASLSDDAILKKFPKAYFIIYECDQLKDDGLMFAKRLDSVGIDVKIAFYENCYHGQTQFVDPINGYESSRAVLNDLIEYIRVNI